MDETDESHNVNSPEPGDSSFKNPSEVMDNVDEEESVEYFREEVNEVPDVCEDAAAQARPNSPPQSENYNETHQEVPNNYNEPDEFQAIQEVPDVFIPDEDIAVDMYEVYLEDPDQGTVQDTDMYLDFFMLLGQYFSPNFLGQNVPSFYWDLPSEE